MLRTTPTHGDYGSKCCSCHQFPAAPPPRRWLLGKSSCWPTHSRPSVALHENGSCLKIKSSLSTRDYLEQSKELMKFEDDGTPRWFSPMESGHRSRGSPLLLFVPGIDGSGLGLRLHHKKLGEIFDIWCLHVPAADRTPLAECRPSDASSEYR